MLKADTDLRIFMDASAFQHGVSVALAHRAALYLGTPPGTVERWKPVNIVQGDGNEIVIDGLIGDAIDEVLDARWAEDEAESLFFGPRALRGWLEGLNGEPGTMRINSPGGDVFAAVEMLALLDEYAGEITAIVNGLAASAATVLLLGAKRVEMTLGSQLMIHRPFACACGDWTRMQKAADALKKTTGDVVKMYERRMKGEDVEKMLAEETYLNVEEAIATGLADAQREPDMAGDGPDMSALAAGRSARMRASMLTGAV